MNREIKFRAWNGQNMIDLKSTTPLALDPKLNIDGLFIPFGYEWKLMQYTGLKDKNGVEIYEGDIMGWECYEGTKHQVRWVVEYNINQGFKTWSSTKNDEIVLGNIYENPELLK